MSNYTPFKIENSKFENKQRKKKLTGMTPLQYRIHASQLSTGYNTSNF
ncbi:hypothetical protein [Saliterribacillus persicus]|nr:hypothetical protein [Saliterribacillus persicus]